MDALVTNEAMTRELCRQIRGVALNYPAGFDAIARQVDELRPMRVATSGYLQVAVTATEPETVLTTFKLWDESPVTLPHDATPNESEVAGNPEAGASETVEQAGAQLSGRVAPKQEVLLKRGRGRPRKQRTGE